MTEFVYDKIRNIMHVSGCRHIKVGALDEYGTERYSYALVRGAASRIATMLNSRTCDTCQSYRIMYVEKGN